MKTADLLKALNIAKPALGAAEVALPVLTHFCFDEEVVYAYNDVAAIVAEVTTGLRCALHGETLVALLEASGEDDVDVKFTKESASLVFKSGNVKLPYLESDSFVFTFPEDENFPVTMAITAELLKGIELCLLSINTDTLAPEFGGVTIRVNKDGMTFYSSDNVTAGRYIADKKLMGRNNLAVVVPQQACSHLIKLASTLGMEGAKFMFNDRLAVAAFPGGVNLITKLLAAKAEQFDGVFSLHASGDADMVDVPDFFARELTKAQILTSKDQTKTCHLEAGGGKLTVSAEGLLGTMKAELKSRSEGAVDLQPDKVLRVLPHVTKMSVNDKKSLVFKGDAFTHIISNIA